MTTTNPPVQQNALGNEGGADVPDTPREPAPPSSKDLPDLPQPQEVGEDG